MARAGDAFIDTSTVSPEDIGLVLRAGLAASQNDLVNTKTTRP